MKMFLVLIAIIGIQPAIAQIDREELVSAVKEAIEESDNSRRRVRYTTLSNESRKIAEQELEEARKAVEARIKRDEETYEERQKYRAINYLHNTEPWWVSVNTNESQEEVNKYNYESSDIESTEKTSHPIKTWQIVAGIVACILLFYEGMKYVVRRIKKSTEI
ncbi:hypothetical protein G5B10_07890 [Fluviicola sp. SGL-29]|nr:hypothetical protein [Fluviicola sp. SGL-29]